MRKVLYFIILFLLGVNIFLGVILFNYDKIIIWDTYRRPFIAANSNIFHSFQKKNEAAYEKIWLYAKIIDVSLTKNGEHYIVVYVFVPNKKKKLVKAKLLLGKGTFKVGASFQKISDLKVSKVKITWNIFPVDVLRKQLVKGGIIKFEMLTNLDGDKINLKKCKDLELCKSRIEFFKKYLANNRKFVNFLFSFKENKKFIETYPEFIGPISQIVIYRYE